MLLLHCAGLVDYAVPYGCYCFGHPSHDVAESVDGYLGAVKGLAPKLLHRSRTSMTKSVIAVDPWRWAARRSAGPD